jgi:hypothetical protein
MMKTTFTLCALTLVAALAGCQTQQPTDTSAAGGPPATGSSTSTEMNSRMCQVFRSYKDRAGGDASLQEACVRQLGQEGCKACLSGS